MAQKYTLEMVKSALNAEIYIYRLVGAKACKKLDEDLDVYSLWERSSSWAKRAAALYGEKKKASKEFLLKSLMDDNTEVRKAANWVNPVGMFSDSEVMKIFRAYPQDVADLGEYVEHTKIDISTLASLVYSYSWQERCFAQRASHDLDCPSEWIFKGLRDRDPAVRRYAIKNAKDKGISIDTLSRWANDSGEPLLWRSILEVCQGEIAALPLIDKAIDAGVDIDRAGEALIGMDIPMDTLYEWYDRDLWHRVAAIYGAIGQKSVPDEWLKDKTNLVYKKPLALLRKSLGCPPTRDFTPPEVVYKSCIKSVMVTGVIPEDAEIRGDGILGRTNKMLITSVVGDFFGEEVGFSAFDLETSYRAGDEVEETSFDMGDGLYAPGIHFYCSKDAIRT